MSNRNRKQFLALLLVTLLSRVYPVWALDYGGVNLNTRKDEAEMLYPAAVREFFDNAEAMFTDDVRKVNTPTISGANGGAGTLKAGHGSTEYGEEGATSSTQEIIDFVKSLPTTCMRWQVVGSFPDYDPDGKTIAAWHDMVLMVFSRPSNGSPVFTPSEVRSLGRPVVWIGAQIHGNENSATEAALELSRRLAAGEFNSVLDKVTVCVLPRWNLDGSRRYQRGTNIVTPKNINRVNMDQNRDHIALQSEFTKLIHRMIADYDPAVAVDIHEMGYTNGSGRMSVEGVSTAYWEYQLHDIASLPGMNPNVPERVRNMAYDVFQENIKKALESRGFYWFFYDESLGATPVSMDSALSSDLKTPVPGGYNASLKSSLSEGTTDEGIGRPNLGFLPAVSFLVESRSPKVMPNLLRRTYTHYLVAASVLETARDNAAALKEMKRLARQEMLDENTLILRQQYPAEQLDWPVLRWKSDFSDVEAGTRKLTAWRSRYAKADPGNSLATATKPTAYILPKNDVMDKVAGKLVNVGVELELLTAATEIEAETYTVTKVDRGIGFVLEGRSGVKTLGGIDNNEGIQEVTKTIRTVSVPAGSYVMYTRQVPATVAALALEPMGMRNFANYWYVNSDDPAYCAQEGFYKVAVGEEYPVYRYVKNDALPTSPIVSGLPPFISGTTTENIVPVLPSDITELETQTGKSGAAWVCRFDVMLPLKNSGGFTLYVPTDVAGGEFYLMNTQGQWQKVEAVDGAITVGSDFISGAGRVFAAAWGRDGGGGGSSSGCNAFMPALVLLMIFSVVAAGKRKGPGR